MDHVSVLPEAALAGEVCSFTVLRCPDLNRLDEHFMLHHLLQFYHWLSLLGSATMIVAADQSSLA